MKRTLLLLFLLAGVQYPIWFGKGNVQDLRALKSRVEQKQEQVTRLEIRNRMVAEQIKDLKQGQEAIAEIARDELGFIADKEHYYRIK